MANSYGGARAGAGRKPRAEKYAGPVAAAESRIVDRLPELVDNLFKLAEGVMVEKLDREGNERVFKTAPSLKANTYLIDRILGRPTRAVELSGPDGEAVPVSLEALSTDGLNKLRQVAGELAQCRSRGGDTGD